MQTEYFVNKDSIVRKIWGNGDTILFIFAGSAAEFALNKAVDWLYFTGKLPSDPLGRLFSTVAYARLIVFSEMQPALKSIDTLAGIHAGVEAKRGMTIPDWAYRDVLFMLIDYSILAYEVLERKLTANEKHEVFDVFNRVGLRMGLKGLPETYAEWVTMRRGHLEENLERSIYTEDLFRQYKKHLGPVRYQILRESQAMVVPGIVRKMLGLRRISLLSPLIGVYKFSKVMKADWLLKALVQPAQYRKEIKALDISPT